MGNVLSLDCTGLSCPQPVLETKKALQQSDVGELRIAVDNYVSKENVARFARNQQYEVEIVESGNDAYEIIVRRPVDHKASVEKQIRVIPKVSSEIAKTLVYVGSELVGSGDIELGKKLMKGFLRTLLDTDPKPWRMIFINSGVKLTTIENEAVEILSLLQDRGVEILSCGTCLEHFGIQDNLRVGKITNMFEVIATMHEAEKVISPS